MGDLLRRRQRPPHHKKHRIRHGKTQDGRRAMFMFGNMAAGKGSFIGGIMEVCGLKTVAIQSVSRGRVPSREFIIAANPQIVFVEYASESDKLYLEAFYKSDPVWSSTDAVKNDAVCFMPRNIVTIPSYRIMETISLMRDFSRKQNKLLYCGQ
ncbi:MAG: ABC transporter substrate-binding protein [Bacilli bacterium]